MFEKFFSRLVNSFVGKYFTVGDDESASSSESSAPSSMELSVWSGYFHLQNLRLRQTFADALMSSLPLRLHSITVTSVQCTIPWTKISKEPIVIVIDGVCALVGTEVDSEDDDSISNSKQRRRENRRRELSSPKATTAASGENDENSDDEEKKSFLKNWLGYGLLRRILNSVQIHVRDVSLRFEDVDPITKGGYAIGLTLESMHGKSADDNGSDAVVKKLFQVNHLSVYWNKIKGSKGSPTVRQQPTFFPLSLRSETASLSQVKEMMIKLISRRSSHYDDNGYDFVLSPVDLDSFIEVPVFDDETGETRRRLCALNSYDRISHTIATTTTTTTTTTMTRMTGFSQMALMIAFSVT